MLLADMHRGLLNDLQPWRSFQWYESQKHFPGWQWCSTVDDFVPYESRLERDRLIVADFDPAVVGIKSQPFQLTHRVDGRVRRHTPDFLLTHDDGSLLIVNVKSREGLEADDQRARLEAAATTFQQRGWGHELWTGASTADMANLRILVGHNRGWLFSPRLIDRVLALADGRTISDVVLLASLDAHPSRIKPVIFHLLWTGQLTTDLSEDLDSDTVLRTVQ